MNRMHLRIGPNDRAAAAGADHADGSNAARGAAQVGIGLRQPHYREWAERRVALGFVEVHSENFFADGGAALAALENVRETHAVSLHGVGLALGSAVGIDAWHLERLARLVERIEPVRVSDHACFARAPFVKASSRPAQATVFHAADLLPIAFTPASLDILCTNVDQVQERLRRSVLVENLSAYLSFNDAEQMPEPVFFSELVRRTGCSLLLDVNNLVVNAINAQRDGLASADPVALACAFIDALPPGAVGEFHLAGYCDTGSLVIDDHGSRVHAPVWAVYEHALARFGALPSLIEWDTDVPSLDVLLDEAGRAACRQNALPAPRAAA
ncbi:DUF692 domain-containing protein [Methylibium sp.]|uniref:DUF692 domain-containing protein n=1 Tax=Methylibium sp. TaxID=2067992 RepID=UPI0025F3118E|nr:DUF692 domain-containing protein [Methylibium sp.]